MKLFSVKQFGEWDKKTIQEKNISNFDLINYAAAQCTKWLVKNYSGYDFIIVCGKGNNGGDGLSISRQLQLEGETVFTFLPSFDKGGLSYDCELQARITNFEPKLPSPHFLLDRKYVIIDAISGTGLRYPADERIGFIIDWINECNSTVISIDIPSGLPGDFYNFNQTASVVKAKYILTFQLPKLSFFQPDSLLFYQNWILIDIDLSKEFYENENADYFLIDEDDIQNLLIQKNHNSNKYNYGHLLLFTGSTFMPGAGLLAAMGATRSGIGLITTFQTHGNTNYIIPLFPEIQIINNFDNVDKYDVLTIGCGIEKNEIAETCFEKWMCLNKPIVIDASGLDILKEMWKKMKLKNNENSDVIITPHLGEYRKLFNVGVLGFKEQLEHEQKMVNEYNVVLVSKGPFTRIYNKNGKCYINNMANSGLSKAGTGDILAGLIGGIRGWINDSFSASVLGVHFHSKAALLAIEYRGVNSVRVTDIADLINIK